MEPRLVFAKTAKGREEIEKRTYRLDAKRRMLLIVVDGHANAQAIADKTGHLGDGFDLLQSLWSDGFIEPAGGSQGAPTPAAVSHAPAAPTPVATQRSLKDLQRAASKAIENILGPNGEALALRLEKTKSVEEFLTEAEKTRESLRTYASQKKADAFWSALGL